MAIYQKDFYNFQGFTPDNFLNYFNALLERVFLYTGLDLNKNGRSPLDSLVHEFVHFFQFIESGKDKDFHKNDFNDDLESEAVRVQLIFREAKACL